MPIPDSTAFVKCPNFFVNGALFYRHPLYCSCSWFGTLASLSLSFDISSLVKEDLLLRVSNRERQKADRSSFEDIRSSS